MKTNRLLPVFLSLATVMSAQTPPPLVTVMEKAAGGLGAGGFVSAEVRGAEVRYASAGKPLPRDGVAPEKVIFEIGSITKVFTSLLLAQAVVEGKAALNDPIGKYLPADLTLAPDTAAITLEQLATHTSGLPRLPGNLAPGNHADPYADYTADRLHDFLRGYHPAKPVPQPAEYSNLGAGLLGHLLERIYGMKYEELLAARITGPLGLADTVITLSPEQETRLAVPYSGNVKVQPWHFDALAGAGAIRSTAADLAKFARALMAPDCPLKAAWDLARQPRADWGVGDKIGLAIFIGKLDGKTFYNHGGGTGGYRSFIELMPEDGRATVLLLNNDAPEPSTLVAAVRAPRPAASAAAARPEVPVDPARLADYPGVYAIDGARRFTVVLDAAGRVCFRLTGQPFLPAGHIGGERFLNPAFAAEFQFGRDAAGKITTLTLEQRGVRIPARRTPEPAPVILFLSADKLQEYPGKYQLAPGAVFEITTRAGHLFAKLTGQPAWPVFCVRADNFTYDVVDAALTFERDGSGAVTALVLHQNGADQRAARLP